MDQNHRQHMMSNGGDPMHRHGTSDDVEQLHARLGFMSMNDHHNGGLTGTTQNQNDYSSHPNIQQRPSNINVIYYSNGGATPVPTASAVPPYQPSHPHQASNLAVRSLNPRAAVFVPRNFTPSNVPMSFRQSNPNGPMPYKNGTTTTSAQQQHQQQQLQSHQQQQQHQHQQQQPLRQHPSVRSSQPPNSAQFEYDNEIEDFLALSYLKDFIFVISNKPAMLNTTGLQEITCIVNSYLNEDECVLELVVNQLVDQSIVDVNFRYSGVKICMHFIDTIHETSTGSFKSLLFKRIQRECSRKVSNISQNTVAHMTGLAFFIGDLFLQSSFDELGQSLPTLLQNLMISDMKFIDQNVKCVCQVLKLCGQLLDEFCKKKNSPEFENVISKIDEILKTNDLIPNVKMLAEGVLKSHQANWRTESPKWSSNVNESKPYYNSEYTETNEEYESENNGVYFPSNGNSNMMGVYDFGNGDEDNQEICDDYETFLMSLPPHQQH